MHIRKYVSIMCQVLLVGMCILSVSVYLALTIVIEMCILLVYL